MEQKKRRRITDIERIKLETLYNSGMSVKEIAKHLERSDKTIYKELQRGRYAHTLYDMTTEWRYSSDKSKQRYKEMCANCGRPLKIGSDHKLVKYLTEKIKIDRYSPAAALASIERENKHFQETICLRTLYNYIYSGMVFLDLTRDDLPEKPQAIKHPKEKVIKRIAPGVSIDKRPDIINTREEFGHWEMDTVVSTPGKMGAILCFTERKTREEMLFKIKTHSSVEPVKVLDRIERSVGTKVFREIFKSITVDNGRENMDYDGLERSTRNRKKRTQIYYCHAYHPQERGSNENQNKLVRRFVPKGADIEDYKSKDIKGIEAWMNRYPRKIFNWRTAAEMFRVDCERIFGYVPAVFST